ncbi:MAG: AAC(3) family N-acetyltransferase [Actinomycetota bacterium]
MTAPTSAPATVDEVADALVDVIGSPRAVALYSASWPLARATRTAPHEAADRLCARLVEALDGTTVLMPTFTGGFGSDGRCDLDTEPATTGVIAERFRTWPGSRRTRSAFFSFAVRGPDADRLVDLEPEHAWGPGSLYEWLHEVDATIATVGLFPTHCSFGHLAEWRYRDRIPYRFEKTFTGTVHHEGVDRPLTEMLLVRERDPAPKNDFTWLAPYYVEAGQRRAEPGGVTVSAIGAQAKLATISSFLDHDPLSLVSNREHWT